MKRKRAAIVRDIHRVFTHRDSFGALSFGGVLPRSGDLIAIQLSIRACDYYGAGSLVFIGFLFAALDVERKIGFSTYELFLPIYGKCYSAKIINELHTRGLLERVPFPETFSHIKRRVKCYNVSEKGHK